MSLLSEDRAETQPTDALRRLVVDPLQRLGALEAQVAELGDLLGKAEAARSALHAENENLRDEIARLKNLRPRSRWSVNVDFHPEVTRRSVLSGN